MYYALDRFGARHPCRWIDDYPFIKGVSWSKGVRFDRALPEPLELMMTPLTKASENGPQMPEYFIGTIPLFRDDLIAALVEAGVDNMDLHAVAIEDPDSGEVHTNYKAVNLLGLIEAADMEASEYEAHDGIALIDVDFDELVIDEEKAGGARMFRLAESVNIILVHEKVRDHLLAKGFDKLEFLDPSDVA